MGVRKLTTVLGIDPGLSGGFAVLQPNQVLQVREMPTVPAMVGKGREIDWHAVAELLCELQPPVIAFLERVHAQGGRAAGRGFGGASMFTFGGAYHGIRASLAAHQIACDLVAPQTWKKSLHLLRSEKDAARGVAMRLFPAQARLFQRKKDIGVADAALIAWYGAHIVLSEEAA